MVDALRPSLGEHRRPNVGPGTEGVLCQVAIGVRRPFSDFQSNPWRQIDLLVFMAKLHLRNNKTEILAREHIDLPQEIAARNLITPLINDRPLPESHERFGFQDRNGEFQFQPTELGRLGLHGE